MTHKGLNRSAFHSFRFSIRPDGISANGSRNDHGLSIVKNKRIKSRRRALDQRFAPLNKVDYIHAIAGVMRHHFCEPMPSCFDKLKLMEPGLFLSPPVAFGHLANPVQ